MAFDRTNATHLAALKTEVETDPTGMSYSAAATDTAQLLALLNDAANNVGNDTINKPTEELDIPDVAGAIDAAEYAALADYDQAWVRMFINRPAAEMLRPYQSKFLQLFGNGSASRTAVLTLRQKPASRAEVLWGVNTVISRQDWFAARDS